LSPDAIAIDVGAHVGLYNTVMARRALRVVAFEPAAEAAAQLRALRFPNCHVIEAAVSDAVGQAVLRTPLCNGAPSDALSTIAPRNLLATDPAEASIVERTVATTTLDSLPLSIVAANEQISFVKIDVEGHEGAVIRGATNIIARHRPVLMIEIEARHGSDVPGLFQTMDMLGYRPYALADGERLVKLDAASYLALQSQVRIGQKAEGAHRYLNNVIFLSRDADAGC
jgi:FkbM family methyltransferase